MDGFIKTVSSNMYGEVRTTMLNGELLLAATDIARCLGYSNPQKAIRDHCKTKGVTELFTPTSGGKQKIKFITKGNVIRLVANSNLPQAEQIESWIFDEVIPNVLEKGGYIVSKDGETPETLMARALLVAKETLNREKEKLQLAQNKITEDAPKVLFAEAVSMSKSSCLVSTLAKILKQNGIDMGEKRLYRWMREKGYLCSKGQYYNKPSQRSMDMHLFEVAEVTITRPTGTILSATTYVTSKGQQYFVDLFLRNNQSGDSSKS